MTAGLRVMNGGRCATYDVGLRAPMTTQPLNGPLGPSKARSAVIAAARRHRHFIASAGRRLRTSSSGGRYLAPSA